jgi:hypothetical protein
MSNDLLAPNLKRPLDRTALGNDVAAINNLVGFLNSPTLATAEADAKHGEMDAAVAMASTTPGQADQAAQAAANPTLVARKAPVAIAPPEPPAAIDSRRIFYSGRLCAGKDYIAAQTGAHIESFAAPLYALASAFFGVEVTATKNKDLPGMRQFLQIAGQWGKGLIDAQYPVSPARAVFCNLVRSAAIDFPSGLGVDWAQYGKEQNIWLDAALKRVEGAEKVAITNVRFGFEFKALSDAGWTNFHVMTTPDEWQARLAKRNIKPSDPVLKDVSEQLAAALDAQVVSALSKQRNGPALCWNSDKPAPSPRLWTVKEFLAAVNSTPAITADSYIITGE